MTVGERIRYIRKQKKIKQVNLAKAVGLTVNGLQKIEYGEVQPKSITIHKIAKALGVSDYDIDDNLKEMFDRWEKEFDCDKLRKEVDLLESISASYGDCIVQLICDFDSLNEQGKQKASDYISDLAGNPKYQK